jgi:exosome complex exonuclease RRP6
MTDYPMSVKPQMYAGLDNTPFMFVESEEQLIEMRDHLALENVKEIAVDLEHHNFRSYQGFTCLMQVSSRERDFVIDTLKLRSILGKYLRPIFADQSKVKVLHGSDYDIEWLQKDFGLYIVNLFDTGQAARTL